MKTDKQKIVSFYDRVEPKLVPVLNTIDFDEWFDVEPDPSKYFYDLCRTIVGQQLAGKAAKAIFERFEKLLVDVSAKKVLLVTPDELRASGLSWAKVRSVRDLSERVVSGSLELGLLRTLGDEELIVELSKVKGIGRWTAEMFLMFRLGHEDIFSFGDLGLKNGLKKFLGKSEMSLDEIKAVTDRWSPYRTYGAIAMWHLLDNQ